MPASWWIKFSEVASDYIVSFVKDRSEYVLDSEPLSQGETNYVVRGQHGGEQVVFKYYSARERWKNELFCLNHFEATGVVPKVIESVQNKMTVMSFIPGTMPRRDGIDGNVLSDPTRRNHLSYQVGRATAEFASRPLPTDSNGKFPPPEFEPFPWFPWSSNLQEAIQFYVDLGRRIQREVSAYRNPIFSESLSLIEYQSHLIEEERKILFHDDFGNMHVFEGELQGIFDLEACRLGTESMQLSKGLHACEAYSLNRESFILGYEEVTGSRACAEDQLRMLAMQQLERLLRICSHGNWHGTDDDKVTAAQISEGALKSLQDAVQSYRNGIDINRWFPSMKE